MIGSKLALFKELSFSKQKSQFSETTIRTTVVQKDQSNGTPIVSHLGAIKVWVITRGGVEDTRLEAKAKDTKKNPRPRPRTAFPRTDSFEAKDQEHKRKCSTKKKVFKKFSGDLLFTGVPRIFDFEKPKPQITCNDVIKYFQKRKFLWDKDIVGRKI